MIVDTEKLNAALKNAGYQEDGEVMSIINAVGNSSVDAAVSQRDLGFLCICAIRYCHGRQTYMPSLIQEIVLNNLYQISDNDLQILINDCGFQEQMCLFGDDMVDKPGWIIYRNKLNKEKEKRGM